MFYLRFNCLVNSTSPILIPFGQVNALRSLAVTFRRQIIVGSTSMLTPKDFIYEVWRAVQFITNLSRNRPVFIQDFLYIVCSAVGNGPHRRP